MATYGWYPLDTSNPLAYTWSPTGNWSNGAYWADLAGTSFPPSTGTVPGVSDVAYIIAANAPSFITPSPFPAPPYNVDITVNTAQSVGTLGMAVYEPFAFSGITATPPVIDVTGASFFVTGSIVDNFTATFPTPIGTQTVSGGGAINLASSASLEVGTTIDAGITVHFNDASDKVILDGVNGTSSTAALGLFTNFQAGDVITLSSVAVAGATITNYNIFTGALTVSTGALVDAVVLIKGSTSLTLSSFSLRPDSVSGLDIVTCFAEGTRIRTPFGETSVEALNEGDMVTIQDPQTGANMIRAIRWIGRRRINLRRHRRPELASPIRIRANACGDCLPHRDLLVSPDHALFLDGVLIPARLLVNGSTIVQETGLRAVQYFHVELERHSVLLAEGLPAESYLDTGNRGLFDNGGLPLLLHPEFAVDAISLNWERDACAPLGVEPSVVEPAWRRLVARAAELGFSVAEETADVGSDPWLEVDGQILHGTATQPDHYLFALPAQIRARSVRLRSGASRPSDRTPWIDDRRSLGISVERILLHGQTEVTELPLDHPELADGWWQAERQASRLWRWTDGNAALDLREDTQMIEIRTRRCPLQPGTVTLAA